MSRSVTAAGIAITLIAWAAAALHDTRVFLSAFTQGEWLVGAQAILYITLVSVLVYGSLVYLLDRKSVV